MRIVLSIIWFLSVVVALYLYFFHSDFFQSQFEAIVHSSIYSAYAILFLIGVIRGFTLIPVTYLIILGALFFPPVPLFFIIMASVMISSASVYYFFEFLNLDTYFEKNHSKYINRIKSALEKNELPIIIGWSAFPLLPTDLICYICGTLEVDIKKLLLGILIGEGLTCSIYIFFGNYLIDYLHFIL